MSIPGSVVSTYLERVHTYAVTSRCVWRVQDNSDFVWCDEPSVKPGLCDVHLALVLGCLRTDIEAGEAMLVKLRATYASLRAAAKLAEKDEGSTC